MARVALFRALWSSEPYADGRTRQRRTGRAVEATLAELGRAIAAGETLALPPFGKARVSRQKTVKGSEVLVLRLRRPGPGAETPDTHPDLDPHDEY